LSSNGDFDGDWDNDFLRISNLRPDVTAIQAFCSTSGQQQFAHGPAMLPDGLGIPPLETCVRVPWRAPTLGSPTLTVGHPAAGCNGKGTRNGNSAYYVTAKAPANLGGCAQH